MFIWLTMQNIGQVLVNAALITAGKTAVCFTGGEMDKCPFDVPTCKCNSRYGYCISCFECLNKSNAVHNIHL